MIDINEITSVLPHKYPFLLVDRIINIIPGQSIVGIKNVTYNEPHFTGHFPSHPVMPGVLIIESLAQVAAILVSKSFESNEPKIPYLTGIDKAKFRKLVTPGDTLTLHAKILQNKSFIWKIECRAEVDSVLAAEAEITAALKPDTKNHAKSNISKNN